MPWEEAFPEGEESEVGTATEKLKRVKEAEDRAAEVIAASQARAEEILRRAREEGEALQESERAKARERGEEDLREKVGQAEREAEEIRRSYREEKDSILREAREKYGEAVAYLLRQMEEA
jgi:vacuolar-type H+-ATPase subunit H